MNNIIEVTLDENTKIYLEAIKDDIENEENGLFTPVASGGVIQKAKSFLDETFNQIKAFSSSIADSIKSLDVCPDELEVKFAVKFAANAGIIISNVSSEANIIIKLKWNKT